VFTVPPDLVRMQDVDRRWRLVLQFEVTVLRAIIADRKGPSDFYV
jgi:hypothetical protein